jgi:hypothetical protein
MFDAHCSLSCRWLVHKVQLVVNQKRKKKTLFQSKTNMKDDIKVLSAENDDENRLTLILLKFHMVEGFIFKLCQILELMNLALLLFPSHSAPLGNNLVSLSPLVPALKAQTASQPDYKFIHVSADTRHFEPEACIKQQTENVTQQEIWIIRRGLFAQWAHIIAELPLHGVESTLKANVVQVDIVFVFNLHIKLNFILNFQSHGNSAGVADE